MTKRSTVYLPLIAVAILTSGCAGSPTGNHTVYDKNFAGGAVASTVKLKRRGYSVAKEYSKTHEIIEAPDGD